MRLWLYVFFVVWSAIGFGLALGYGALWPIPAAGMVGLVALFIFDALRRNAR